MSRVVSISWYLLRDALVLGREGVAHMAQRADPEAALEVDLCVGVEDCSTGLAGDRLVWNHL